jgi:hypothetical protein
MTKGKRLLIVWGWGRFVSDWIYVVFAPKVFINEYCKHININKSKVTGDFEEE